MASPEHEHEGEPADSPPAEHEGQEHEAEHEPEHPPVPPHADGSGDRLDRLEGIVNGLVDIVAGLAPKDEKPTKVPWTHRFGRDDR